MNDKRNIYIETFRPLDDGDKTTSHRPTERPAGKDKPVNIGGPSIIKPPAGGKKPPKD